MKKGEIEKKSKELKEQKKSYYAYNEKLEITKLSEEDIETLKVKNYESNHMLRGICEASISKPTLREAGGIVGSREANSIILKTAQSIEHYEFPKLIGFMPINFTLTYLSSQGVQGAFGLDRLHYYEKHFYATQKDQYRLDLPDGRWFSFEKDSEGNFSDKGGLGVKVKSLFPQYNHNEEYLLIYPNGFSEYYSQGHLVTQQDRNGNTITLEYEKKRLKFIRNNSGSFFHFHYHNGKVTIMNDHSGRAWQFSYTIQGYLESISLNQHIDRRYEYLLVSKSDQEANYHLKSVMNVNGEIQLGFAYNAYGEAQSVTHSQTEYYYHWYDKNQIEVVENQEKRIFYGLDITGAINTIVYADGTHSSEEWDITEREARIKTRGGQEKLKRYDVLGRLLEVKINEKVIQSYRYEGNNPYPSVIQNEQELIEYSYDEHYNRIAICYEDSTQKLFTYTPEGMVSSITDAQGNQTNYSYNHQGNLTKQINAHGVISTFVYDHLGRLIKFTSPKGATEHLSYNQYDQITSYTNALDESTLFKYDLVGNLTSITDPAGRTTKYLYDCYGRVVLKESPKGYQESPYHEHYSYNIDDTLQKITRRDGSILSFSYDLNNNITKVVATDIRGNQEEQSYMYDALSNLEEASTQKHHLEILYNKKANPVIEIQDGIDVTHGYHENEERIQTLTVLNQVRHYSYDEFAKLLSINFNLQNINFDYDTTHKVIKRSYPNGKSETLNYDAEYNLLSIGDEEEYIIYEYNENSEVIRRQHSIQDEKAIEYGYNLRGELIQAGEIEYGYNQAGNRVAEGYRYNLQNHLLETEDYSYRYDDRGNLQTKINKEIKSKTIYTFNLFDQLIQVSTKDQENQLIEELMYEYDALNRRVKKTENGVVYHYLYDGFNIVAILDYKKELLATITHDTVIDTPLSITTYQNTARELSEVELSYYNDLDEESKVFLDQKRKQRTYYYHRDHLGSIIKLTNEEGKTVESFRYDAYGTIVEYSKIEETLNPYCYTAREFDTFELYYYRARYYDPTVGRFISSDPIEFFSRDYNFYRYTWNNPIKFTDPLGLCPPCAAIAGRLLLAAAIKYGPKIAKAIIKEIKNEIKEEVKDVTTAEVNQVIAEKSSELGLSVEGLKAVAECGKKDTYKKSKKSTRAKKANVSFHRDHMPSDAAMQERAKSVAKGMDMTLCSKAQKAIRDGATTIMLPDFVHIDGRTYGGKNNATQIAGDAKDLGKAAKDDVDEVKKATDKALKEGKIDKACAKAIKDSLKSTPTNDAHYENFIKDAITNNC